MDAIELLWDDGEFVLCRKRPEDGCPAVLLTSPTLAQPRPGTIRRLEHAYALRDQLDSTWAARPLTLIQRQDRPLLLLEDAGGEPLARLLGQPMPLTQLLRLAIGMAAALQRLHERSLMHKDVKPANILVNPTSGQVRLTGFGIASRLPRERQPPEPPEVLAGTLAYMAPEQTGRMNRSVDARSDLYALGVTLYEMLTGVLPFTATDPMGWVHSHIARQPTPPIERLAGVPGPLSAIVMKLLAKTPEERYQTAAGVETDLRRCLTEWEAFGRIDPFALGTQDVSDRLRIPEKLYGRESEVSALRGAFEEVVTDGVSRLVLISGYSGIGKSSVVNELHKVLVPRRGVFASGKFDQHKCDVPYAAVAQAFQGVIRQILSQPEDQVARWRAAIVAAVGGNGGLIANLIPELERVIGKQPPVADLPPPDAERRFRLVLRRFFAVFARAEHPLVLFLDDLQWLDNATLVFLEQVVSEPAVRHLLLVGAYRDNEAGPTHPLRRTLEAMRQTEARVREVVLAPLGRQDVNRLVADALHCEIQHARPLAELVHEKTAGNPLFAIQFLTALAEDRLLAFKPDAAAWTWNLARIQAKGFTENVADLVTAKLSRLPPVTLGAVKQFACLGNSAATASLAIALGMSEDETHAALWDAVQAGLVFRSDDAYSLLHDRVREAAYALIPAGERAALHLALGRRLEAHTPGDKVGEAIFDIVNQLTRGAALITARRERERLAELNLIAGKRGKAATAYGAALPYLSAGGALLGEDRWARCYGLAFGLELHRAECEFLTGQLAIAEERLSTLSRRVSTLVDEAAVTCLRVRVCTALDQYDRAVEVGCEYLRHAGVVWSPQPTDADVREEYERMWTGIGGRTIEELIDLPLMTVPEQRATMDVLVALLEVSLFTDGNLFALVLGRMVNLSLEYGNSEGSCLAYAEIIMVLAPRFGDYRSGFRFGQLGFDLVERRGLDRYGARVYLVFAHHVVPWMRRLGDGEALVQRALAAAQETGDLTFAAYSSTLLTTNLLASGVPLVQVLQQAEEGLAAARQAGFGGVVAAFIIQIGLIGALRGLAPGRAADEDTEPNAGWFEQRAQADLALTVWWYWVRKLQARFYAGDYAGALEAAVKAEAFPWTTSTFFEAAEYRFYGALAHAAVYDLASADERARHREALVAHHGQLASWAENCPQTFADRAALVGAEIARIDGRELDAERLYEAAIRTAREQGFIQNEGVANELAARFYTARGFETIAHAYLRNARYCYLRWGADSKVRQLDHAYPHLGKAADKLPATTTIDATAAELDLGTVVRMSEAVSGEIVLDELIRTLMVIAVTHAGAERGLLILPHGVEPRVEAEATTNAETVTVRLGSVPATAAQLPQSVLEYVTRTQDSVILGDACTDDLFGEDPYIRQHHARSVLSLPLVKQAKLIGVLYLENNLTAHVFTPTRMALLKLLASQAAIALENARLYGDLRHENLERKHAEEAVRTEQSRLKGILEIADDAIISVGSDQHIVLFNRGAEKIFGYAESEVIGKPLDRLMPQRFVEAHRGHLEEFARSADVARPMGQRREVFGRRRDGREFSAEASISKLDLDGELVFTVILRDITERKRAAEVLQRSEAYLAQGQRLTRTGTWAEELSTGELYWSQEMFCILGLDPAKGPLAMADLLLHVHPEDRRSVEEAVTGAASKGCSFDHSFRIVRPNGETVFIRSVGTAVSDEGGVQRYFGTIMDVTEHEQMTQAIRSREAELRQLIDFVPQHIIVLGPDGHRLYANKVSLEYTGRTLAEFLAPEYDDVIHPDDLERIRGEAHQVADGAPFEMEGRMRGKDGRYRWFLLRYNPLRDEDGHVVRWYVTGTDIDDRKAAEERVRRENIALRDEVDKTSMFEEIVGASPALQAVLSRITKVAPTESTVLITGETGTGKELIARAIHKRSARSGHAFVSVNCAGIPQSLIASELFGHEKGAFTGALQRRLGRFELAEGGTLFLDEVGELPAETQITLLRVLQEREFERVGGNKVVRADVRLIAATNRDLQAAVAAGTFRSDLFYRLNVFPIWTPPLRQRTDDIPMLVDYFVARYASKAGKKISGIEKKTLDLLRSYPWPGNIRELQNVIERSVILCETENFSIDEHWLSGQPPPPRPAGPVLNDQLVRDQKALIEAALAEAKGRVSGPSGAAAKLGLPPSTLDSKIKALKIDKQRFKRG